MFSECTSAFSPAPVLLTPKMDDTRITGVLLGPALCVPVLGHETGIICHENSFRLSASFDHVGVWSFLHEPADRYHLGFPTKERSQVWRYVFVQNKVASLAH